MEGSWPGPSMLKKSLAKGARGLGAPSGGGSGSMWRTEIARLPKVILNTSSGLDSSPWALDGWAETQRNINNDNVYRYHWIKIPSHCCENLWETNVNIAWLSECV